MKSAYEYVSDALDELLLLRSRCQISVKIEKLLDKSEIALTELLDAVDPDLPK
jgi:hypothetical protein